MSHTLPSVLKELRNNKNMSQQAIADKICIAQRTYSSYETGNREPDINTLIKLADLFTVPVDVLIGRYQLPKQ